MCFFAAPATPLIVSPSIVDISFMAREAFPVENKTSLTTGAAVGGVLGMVVGGPVLGAAAGIGATILKKSDKFNELLFGTESFFVNTSSKIE